MAKLRKQTHLEKPESKCSVSKLVKRTNNKIVFGLCLTLVGFGNIVAGFHVYSSRKLTNRKRARRVQGFIVDTNKNVYFS